MMGARDVASWLLLPVFRPKLDSTGGASDVLHDALDLGQDVPRLRVGQAVSDQGSTMSTRRLDLGPGPTAKHQRGEDGRLFEIQRPYPTENVVEVFLTDHGAV